MVSRSRRRHGAPLRPGQGCPGRARQSGQVAERSRRRQANASGVDNLFLAGDWIDNGFNAGCVEASFMSGMQAGNAMLGHPLNDGIQGRELCSD